MFFKKKKKVEEIALSITLFDFFLLLLQVIGWKIAPNTTISDLSDEVTFTDGGLCILNHAIYFTAIHQLATKIVKQNWVNEEDGTAQYSLPSTDPEVMDPGDGTIALWLVKIYLFVHIYSNMCNQMNTHTHFILFLFIMHINIRYFTFPFFFHL